MCPSLLFSVHSLPLFKLCPAFSLKNMVAHSLKGARILRLTKCTRRWLGCSHRALNLVLKRTVIIIKLLYRDARGLQYSLCVLRGLGSSALNQVYCAAGIWAVWEVRTAKGHKRNPRPSVPLDIVFLGRLTVA
jgi:hypothetical protein